MYYVRGDGLIPPNQFGAMPGTSTTDAALYLGHDIHAVNNHNLYCDNVNHNRLLAVLQNWGIPLRVCRCVQSFVNSRETRIRVDGYTDKAKAMQTGCPQNSPVSGVLANYYSTMLLEMFMQGTR